MPPEQVNATRLLVFVGGLALWGVLEGLWPDRRPLTPALKRWGFHGALAIANTVFLRVLVVAPFLGAAQWIHDRGWGLVPALGLQGWFGTLVAVVALDACNYLWHRINHEWPVLWRFHRVHHEDTEVTTSTSLRFHPGELLLSAVVKLVWLAAVGPSAVQFALFESLISFAAQFHHGNIRWPRTWDRALRWVVPSPLFHAAHHTKHPRSRNGNYGTLLTVWDALGRTYHSPQGQNLDDLGVPGAVEPFRWRAQLLGPFLKG